MLPPPFFFTSLKIHAEFNVQVEFGRHIREWMWNDEREKIFFLNFISRPKEEEKRPRGWAALTEKNLKRQNSRFLFFFSPPPFLIRRLCCMLLLLLLFCCCVVESRGRPNVTRMARSCYKTVSLSLSLKNRLEEIKKWRLLLASRTLLVELYVLDPVIIL